MYFNFFSWFEFVVSEKNVFDKHEFSEAEEQAKALRIRLRILCHAHEMKYLGKSISQIEASSTKSCSTPVTRPRKHEDIG